MKTLLTLAMLGLAVTSSTPTKCVATWYDMHGQRTASGTRMHRDSLTAAYNYAPFGTQLQITNCKTQAVCTVTVTDRMGVKATNRIDLSKAAFGCIAPHTQGRVEVLINKIE
jgi:rare lipoprotein A